MDNKSCDKNFRISDGLKKSDKVEYCINKSKTINKLPEKYPFRCYTDSSTSAFTSVFFQNPEISTTFINYTYHALYSSIVILLNDYLINNNYEPLNRNESVYIIFKGGTVINKIFSKFETDRNKNYTDFKKYFGVSDIDYSLFINANTLDRHDEIYQVTTDILYHKLNEIADKFDSYYNNMSVSFNNKKEKNILILNSSEESNKHEHIARSILSDIKNNNNKSIDWKLQDMIFTNINYYFILSKSKYMYIHWIYILLELLWNLYNNVDSNRYKILISDLYNYFINKLDLYVSSQFDELIRLKFYDISNFREFYTKIVSNLINNCGNTSYVKIKDEGRLHYSINKECINDNDIDNIMNVDKISSEFKFTNDKYDCNTKNTKIHYISFNETICDYRFDNNLITNFDLLRVKFNVEFKKCITINNINKSTKIPSEFIDISLTRFDDVGRVHYFEYLQNNPYILEVKYNNFLLSVYSYSPVEILDDLEFLMMYKDHIEPWRDNKYEKRIYRIVYFMIYNCFTNNIINIDELHKCDNIIFMCNILHKNLYNYILVREVPLDNNIKYKNKYDTNLYTFLKTDINKYADIDKKNLINLIDKYYMNKISSHNFLFNILNDIYISNLGRWYKGNESLYKFVVIWDILLLDFNINSLLDNMKYISDLYIIEYFNYKDIKELCSYLFEYLNQIVDIYNNLTLKLVF